MLIELRQILQSFGLGALTHNGAEHVSILAEAMKWMTIDKDAHMGDPDFVDVPLDMVLSPVYAAERASSIKAGEKVSVPRSELAKDLPDTTVTCVMDEEGSAVTITHMLGQPSGAITHGLGFMYKGTMSGFDPRPGRAASIAPGKARGSAMAPTIVFQDDRPVIVMGRPVATSSSRRSRRR